VVVLSTLLLRNQVQYAQHGIVSEIIITQEEKMIKFTKLSPKQLEHMFLDIWWNLNPESYDSIWYKGIEGEQLISDLVEINPKLYKQVLDIIAEKSIKEHFSY